MALTLMLTVPAGMSADQCASHLLTLAIVDDQRTAVAFNGTPMVAYPSDNQQVVLLRWNYERRLRQVESGVLSLRDAMAESDI